MQNLSVTALCIAAQAMTREIHDLETLVLDHQAIGSLRAAAYFAGKAAQIEQARAEINAAIGGAK